MSDRNIFGLKKKNKFLDNEVKDRLLFAISQGSYIVDACAYAGISNQLTITGETKQIMEKNIL